MNSNLITILDDIKVAVLYQEAITVNANSNRIYKFGANFSYKRILLQLPVITLNGFGITCGRYISEDFAVQLWNNTSSSKNVDVYFYVLYI